MLLLNLIKRLRKRNFKDLANEWLEVKKITIKESTYYKYKYIIKKYLIPEIGRIKKENLEKQDLNQLIRDFSENLSVKTTREIINVLKGILKFINSQYKTKIEIDSIIKPKVYSKEVEIMTRRERRKLEKACLEENSLKSIGIFMCLNTGLRVGEICALKWENIDIGKKTIQVKKTLQRIYVDQKKTRVIIDNPKTVKSVRTIPISNKLYDVLKPMKRKYEKQAFFLTGEKDKFIEPRTYQNYFKLLLQNNKIKKYKFHILRHTFATNCIEVGMDIKSLSEILGHSTVDITLNRYVHSSLKMKKEYLEKL